MWCSLGFWYKSNAVRRNVFFFFPRCMYLYHIPGTGTCGVVCVSSAQMALCGACLQQGCSKIPFALCRWDRIWQDFRPSEIRGRQWGQFTQAGGEQLSVWFVSSSDCPGSASFMEEKQRGFSLADPPLLVFLLQGLASSTCPACVTCLSPTPDSP